MFPRQGTGKLQAGLQRYGLQIAASPVEFSLINDNNASILRHLLLRLVCAVLKKQKQKEVLPWLLVNRPHANIQLSCRLQLVLVDRTPCLKASSAGKRAERRSGL